MDGKLHSSSDYKNTGSSEIKIASALKNSDSQSGARRKARRTVSYGHISEANSPPVPLSPLPCERRRPSSQTLIAAPLYDNRDSPLQAFLQSLLVKLGMQIYLYFHVSGNSTLTPSRLMNVLGVRERNDAQILEYLASSVARQLDLAGVEVDYLP